MKEGITYGKCCCLCNVDTDTDRDVFKYPVRIDAYVLVICSNGLIELTYNLSQLTLSSGNMFLYSPGAIVRLNAIEPSQLSIMVFTRDFFDSLGIKFDNVPLQFRIVNERPVFILTQDCCRQLQSMLGLVCDFIGLDKSNSYYNETVQTAFRTFIYRAIYEINDRYGKSSATEQLPYQENSHFYKFMRLLQENYTRHHNIQFYSGKMGLTPKYLSLMIKKISGRLATEWIDDYVILEAKNLIKYSSMSIQEISYALNFPNQSFFGKYFKRHTGLSPKAYRQQQ